ncbi:MAG: type II secretion system secretin GspD [Pseudomonadota bacterium]
MIISLLRAFPIPLVFALSLVGCSEKPEGPSTISRELSEVSFDVPPNSPQRDILEARSDAGQTAVRPQPEIFLGNDGATPSTTGRVSASRLGDGVQINFERAELREVVRVILGEILGVAYSLDPGVGGEVTIASSGPLPERDLLALLESVLQMNGAALVGVGEGYEVVPVEQAFGRSDIVPLGGGFGAQPMNVRPGYGVTVIPLRHISAQAAAQFAQPLLRRPEEIRVDETRNILLIVGDSAERQNVVDTLADLDVDWLAGRAVGLFPLTAATPEVLIPELEALFAPPATNPLDTPTIAFLPMARLNAVLAIAPSNDRLRAVERWVQRLDRGNAAGSQFYVYQLRHVPAEATAAILNEAYSGAGTGGGDPNLFTTGLAGDAGLGLEGLDGDGAPADDELGTTAEDLGGFVDGPNGGANGGLGAARQLGAVKIVPNLQNNSLLIRADPQTYQTIEATLRRLDTAPLQVLIEATILEVQLTDELRFGVQYFFQSRGLDAGFNSTRGPANVASNLLSPLSPVPGFNFLLTGGNDIVAIDALDSLTDVKVLSSPSVVVQDNREAVLNVGDEVPIITRTAVSVDDADAPVVNNIEYRDTGVILRVKPRISSNAVVALEIAQEVSRVLEGSVDELTPTIQQRRITSSVNVLSGQTIVLGGLIEDSEQTTRDRVPLLGDLPGIGPLFGSTQLVDARTELIIFITPRVIQNATDARDISEELRARMRSIRPINGPEDRGPALQGPDSLPDTSVVPGSRPPPPPAPPPGDAPTPLSSLEPNRRPALPERLSIPEPSSPRLRSFVTFEPDRRMRALPPLEQLEVPDPDSLSWQGAMVTPEQTGPRELI